jgi:hypothetical protein
MAFASVPIAAIAAAPRDCLSTLQNGNQKLQRSFRPTRVTATDRRGHEPRWRAINLTTATASFATILMALN